MSVNGNILCLNRESRIAAVDIGKGQALVLEWPELPECDIEVGDVFEGLVCGYAKVNVLNCTRGAGLSVTVLSGILAVDVARFVIDPNSSDLLAA